MLLGRKFKIWIISFGVIFIAFLIYRNINDTGIIEITTLDYNYGNVDANHLITDPNGGQLGKAKLDYLGSARFTTTDIKTGKLKRVIGFDKVLHKTGNQWLLEKPCMSIFQDDLRCDITADTGTVEVENVEGADPTPKSAVLQDNVIIHIMPEMVPGPSDSFIYLRQVTFDSDRSRFTSDDDVNFVSADATLMGRGLEVVGNSITNRLEYLEIRKVEYLKIMSLEKTKRAKKEKPRDDLASAPSAVPVQSGTVDAQPVVVEQAADSDKKEGEDKYVCLFRDNVILEYENNEVVLADEIAITNLLWASDSKRTEEPNATASAAANTASAPAENQPVVAPAPVAPRQVIATVKCKGPMIVKPKLSKAIDNYKYAKFKAFKQLSDAVRKMLGRRNVLLSQRVSYDYAEEIARAHDQTELIFYSNMDSESDGKKPFVITSKKGAEFISKKNQAVFSGNVKGGFIKQTDVYDEENTFYGDKLIIDLVKEDNDDKENKNISSGIAHIAVTGPGVRLESVRTLGGKKLSHVRLKSERIDYEKAAEDIIATGKGRIEYVNAFSENNNVDDSGSKSAIDKPCYALVEGFDKLIWDTDAMHVRALSDKTNGIHIGYLPIEKDGYGKKVTIDTRQVDIDYYEPIKGQSQLKQLHATGGVVYYEQQRYEFVGGDLHFNAQDDFLTVTSTEDMPCMLNGVLVEAIEYNLKTDSVSTAIGSGVGIMPVRE